MSRVEPLRDTRLPHVTEGAWKRTIDPPGMSETRCLTVPQWSGPVVCASHETRPGVKEGLVQLLVRVFERLQSPGGARGAECSPVLDQDLLGRPWLRLGGLSGPAVSFTHACGRTWAGLAHAQGVGIDAASPREFRWGYPLGRAFGAGEFEAALGLCRGAVEEGAALLWSLKEASVKALGCGFHLLDPLEVEVEPAVSTSETLLFRVKAGAVLHAIATREGPVWLAVAVVE